MATGEKTNIASERKSCQFDADADILKIMIRGGVGGIFFSLPTYPVRKAKCDAPSFRGLTLCAFQGRMRVSLYPGPTAGMKALPSALGALHSLQTLNLDGCIGLTTIPPSYASMSGLKTLHVTHCTRLIANAEFADWAPLWRRRFLSVSVVIVLSHRGT